MTDQFRGQLQSQLKAQLKTQLWQPTASAQNLQARAKLFNQIRLFFTQRNVLEVETPLLSSATGTDLNLFPFSLKENNQQLFLQTSPEFAMKRLLANGSGPIFQICKAFRQGEAGNKHNPEFTLLEWYRPGLSMEGLMDELEELLRTVNISSINDEEFSRYSYRELFQKELGIDPHAATLVELKELALHKIEIKIDSNDRDTWLDLLFSHVIEPELQSPTFIYHYPKSQAALARVIKGGDGCEVAQRFELVCKGIELANGYFELTDFHEQCRRFEHEQTLRQQAGRNNYPVDKKFLAALEHGLPECSGVALGLDRLLMLICDTRSINDVIAFPLDRA